jgi:hypothetical protein
MATLNFHVRHEVTPERAWGVLDAIANGLDYAHITQSDRQISRLRQLDLLTGKGVPQLTQMGIELHRIGQRRPELIGELFHFLHYSRWRPNDPTEDTMFFTYRDYCELLYEEKTIDLNTRRDRFSAEMTYRISNAPCFVELLSNLAKGAVSLSKNSLMGIEHWLEKLSPEVIANDQFNLRHYCPPELLLMAFGYVTEMTNAQLGIEQPLTDERRKMLCSLCLIDDSVLNQILEWLYPEFPDHIQPGTSTGSYGQFVRLLKLPNLKDLAQ